jgi:hypothetical protein
VKNKGGRPRKKQEPSVRRVKEEGDGDATFVDVICNGMPGQFQLASWRIRCMCCKECEESSTRLSPTGVGSFRVQDVRV